VAAVAWDVLLSDSGEWGAGGHLLVCLGHST